MTKIIGSILLLLSGYLGGFYFSNSCKVRLEQLYELKKMIKFLEGEIRYKKTALPEAFCCIARRAREPFSSFFSSVGSELLKNRREKMAQIWNQNLEKFFLQSKLTKGDKETMRQLGNSLGYLDEKSQIDSLNLYLEQLDEDIKKSQEELYKKERLYQCLGVSSGVLLVILFL